MVMQKFPVKMAQVKIAQVEMT